jgi:hypothetical protein
MLILWWLLVLIVLCLVIFIMKLYYKVELLDFLGFALGRLCGNNNWRFALLFFFTISFVGSASIATFNYGLTPLSKMLEIENPIGESDSKKVKVGLSRAFWLLFSKGEFEGFEEEPKSMQNSTVLNVKPANYASWWHIVLAMAFVLATIAYFPVAFREEAWSFGGSILAGVTGNTASASSKTKGVKPVVVGVSGGKSVATGSEESSFAREFAKEAAVETVLDAVKSIFKKLKSK